MEVWAWSYYLEISGGLELALRGFNVGGLRFRAAPYRKYCLLVCEDANPAGSRVFGPSFNSIAQMPMMHSNPALSVHSISGKLLCRQSME